MDAIAINAINRAFWNDRSALVARQMQDDILRSYALEQIRREQSRGVSIYGQESLEAILDRVDGLQRKLTSRAVKAQALRAARAPRKDVLSQAIELHLQRRPSASWMEVLRSLTYDCPNAVILDVNDEEIVVAVGSSGRTKSVPISGLKDRVSRMRKRLRSR